MSAAVLTTCTAEKSQAPGQVPAGERYRAARVEQAKRLAASEGVPLLFLSGVFGVIEAAHPIPWYDHALQSDEVAAAVAPAVAQLEALGITTLTALLLPESTPGWRPYHRLLLAACGAAGVDLTVRLIATSVSD